MNPYFLAAFALITLLKDTFSELFKSKPFQIVVVGLVGYVLTKKFMLEKKKSEVLQDAQNTGKGRAGDMAIGLHDAFYPIMDLTFNILPFISIPDGTNEEKVYSIAAEMHKLQNFQDVAAAYKSIYNKELKVILADEGVEAEFWNIYFGKSTPPAKATSKTTTTSGGAISQYTKVGSIVKVKGNLRNLKGQVVKRTNTNGLYEVVALERRTVAGISGIWATVVEDNFWPNLTKVKFYAHSTVLVKVK